jgi:UDP-N-acetylglucosamine/UDP-N-acetylgalactosamine diphosphorylase
MGPGILAGMQGISAPGDVLAALVAKGVDIRQPQTVDIGPEVDPDRVSGDGVTIYPGCRIYGAQTVVSAGVTLGSEGPVTVQNVRMGPGVSLAAGYAARSVFLEGAGMGANFHVREGCLLEEQASGAHCVGIKQTILLPFVTLGSLINFCDALMSGGTSRKDHSEVGSSYIHFNFTPDGDKSTPSLFGDVVHGVLLDQPAIFLGGQGGAVGPISVGFGSVAGAGSVVRSDVAAGRLVVPAPPPAISAERVPADYRSVNRLVAKNLLYLAQLQALGAWHEHVRAPYFDAQPLGPLVAEGALEMLDLARRERVSRLNGMLAKVPDGNPAVAALRTHLPSVCRLLTSPAPPPDPALLATLTGPASSGVGYLAAIQGLSAADRTQVAGWLGGLVDAAWAHLTEVLPGVARLPRFEFCLP